MTLMCSFLYYHIWSLDENVPLLVCPQAGVAPAVLSTSGWWSQGQVGGLGLARNGHISPIACAYSFLFNKRKKSGWTDDILKSSQDAAEGNKVHECCFLEPGIGVISSGRPLWDCIWASEVSLYVQHIHSVLIEEGIKITDNNKLSLTLSARNTKMQELTKKVEQKSC